MDDLINNIKIRNKNKNINDLPLAKDIIIQKFYGLHSLHNKLDNYYYINSNFFFIPNNHNVYYIFINDPLFILYKAGISKEFNLIKQTLVTSETTLNTNELHIFISKTEVKKINPKRKKNKS